MDDEPINPALQKQLDRIELKLDLLMQHERQQRVVTQYQRQYERALKNNQDVALLYLESETREVNELNRIHDQYLTLNSPGMHPLSKIPQEAGEE